MKRVKLIGLFLFMGVVLFAQNVINSNEYIHFEYDISIDLVHHIVGVTLLTLALFLYAKWGVKKTPKEFIKLAKCIFLIFFPFVLIVFYVVLFVMIKEGQQPIDKVIDCIPFSGFYSVLKAFSDLDSVNDSNISVENSPGAIIVTGDNSGGNSSNSGGNSSNSPNNTKES